MFDKFAALLPDPQPDDAVAGLVDLLEKIGMSAWRTPANLAKILGRSKSPFAPANRLEAISQAKGGLGLDPQLPGVSKKILSSPTTDLPGKLPTAGEPKFLFRGHENPDPSVITGRFGDGNVHASPSLEAATSYSRLSAPDQGRLSLVSTYRPGPNQKYTGPFGLERGTPGKSYSEFLHGRQAYETNVAGHAADGRYLIYNDPKFTDLAVRTGYSVPPSAGNDAFLRQLQQKIGSLPAALQHILVTGHSGAGKTTLADKLHTETGYPVMHLDKHPLWKVRDGEPSGPHRANNRNLVADALASLREPTIVEGTSLLHGDPELVKQHRRILLDPTFDQIVKQRMGRDLEKGKNTPEATGLSQEEWEKSRREMTRTISQMYRPYVARWRVDDSVEKIAALLPGVQLQEHQDRLEHESAQAPQRKLLVHALGSGKSLTALGMAEAQKKPYTAIVPAALRENFRGEIDKWTDHETPSEVMSYTELAKGKVPENLGTVIYDEAHRLRNQDSAQARRAMEIASKSKQLLLLSGSPIVNSPGDLATPLSMLTGKKITPDEFNSRYVKNKNVYPNLLRRLMMWPSGTEPDINHRNELKGLLRGHVDYYDPGKPTVPMQQEDVHTTMGVEQTRLYKAMWDKLPVWLRWKLKNDTPLEHDELIRMQSFLTGPRQVGLSTYPYQRTKDPLRAFEQSPKLQEANRRMTEHLKDPRKKALVFANFIDAGLMPYSAALAKAGVPHGVFHGGLTDSDRKKLVSDYNDGKIRVALVGPSGTEGLSFKGTQVVQLLDSAWNPVRPRQSIGRAMRFDSHFGLPEDLQNVAVERYVSRLPLGFKERLLSAVGSNQEPSTWASDDHLRHIEERKELTNHKFMDLLKEVGSER